MVGFDAQNIRWDYYTGLNSRVNLKFEEGNEKCLKTISGWEFQRLRSNFHKTGIKAFPNIRGQKIRARDIGKIFVRTRPYFHYHSKKRVFTHIPLRHADYDDLLHCAMRLTKFEDGIVQFEYLQCKGSLSFYDFELLNDGHWCTLDVFCKALKIKPFSKILDIEQEVRELSRKDRAIFERFKNYTPNQINLLEDDEKAVIKYLEGKISLEAIGINPKNAPTYLKIAKLADIAIIWKNLKFKTKSNFPNTTHEIRTLALKHLSPWIQTAQVFTLTVNEKKCRNPDYLAELFHWTLSRQGYYANYVIPQVFTSIIDSSKILVRNHPIPTIVRGNTATGKGCIIEQIFKMVVATLNPDEIKYLLKAQTLEVLLTNFQVHLEATKGPLKNLITDIKKSKFVTSSIVDSRLTTPEEYESLISSYQGKVKIVDCDGSLGQSLRRVLGLRTPTGKDPFVVAEAILKGFREIKHRQWLFDRVMKDDRVESYQLYYNGELAAEKKNHRWIKHSQKLLDECLRIPSEREILQEFKQIITFQYLDHSTKGDCKENFMGPYKKTLKAWKGNTLQNSVNALAYGGTKHAKEILAVEKDVLKKYGTTKVEKFAPQKWLSDLPEVGEHLLSEQLLHIRGLDEKGVGLHWQSHKFSADFDSQYNSEASIQMKLGYFVIPSDNIEMLCADSLSQNVLNELKMDLGGGKIAYRFFVHPENYAHFKPLLEAGIRFVKPENSEFMGTPTSSYRSWAIRRIIPKKKGEPKPLPFIIKLGVSTKDKTESTRLLSQDEIKKSIELQKTYDSMGDLSSEIGPRTMDVFLFPETLGFILKGIPKYPAPNPIREAPVDSGMIIREFPAELLQRKCKILSFSALQSVERSRKNLQGTCSLSKEESGMESLPLIYEIMDATIKKGIVKTPMEFMIKFFIEGFLQAIKKIYLERGIALPLHGQNLCIALNPDNTPRAFVIRDHGDTNHIQHPNLANGFIETLTWFYRYHVFIKLLNVMCADEREEFPPLPGAPILKGYEAPFPERNLHHYLKTKIPFVKTQAILSKLSLTFKDYQTLLQILDDCFFTYLKACFDIDKLYILRNLPSAEPGSSEEIKMILFNKKLFQLRKGYSYEENNIEEEDSGVEEIQDYVFKLPIMNAPPITIKLIDLWGINETDYSNFSDPIYQREVVPPPNPSSDEPEDLTYLFQDQSDSSSTSPASPPPIDSLIDPPLEEMNDSRDLHHRKKDFKVLHSINYGRRNDRILPSEWKEARKDKWGFKTHTTCAGAIRASFGTAIKWEVSKGNVIYINTNSVKHWWKANSAWRKEHGFGGNFSKKKLKELLNAKIS